MTDELSAELAKVREMVGKATPGPWSRTKPGSDPEGWPNGVAVAFVARGQGVYANPPGGSYPASDQDFIAASRSLVPRLLDVIDLLREQRDSAIASHDMATGGAGGSRFAKASIEQGNAAVLAALRGQS